MARLYAILGAVLAILEGGGMNTRKGFIRDGFGIAAILAAQSAPAILVRSMVAARGSFFGRGAGGGGWVNPYVTDGLVAMWDGEWNAGWGLHDPNATTWKDIISGYDLDVTSGTWGDKGLVGTSTNACNATMTTVPQSFIDIISSDGCTVEAVATPLGYGTNIYSFSSSIWSIYGWGNSVIWYWFRIQSGPFNISNKGVIGEPISFSGTTDSNKRARWYCNAQQLGSGTYGSQTANNDVFLGIKGIIHTARIYNRTLSDAEIAANYAIDKERFNLA